MSIWSSFCTFGDSDPPYTDYEDSTGHYTTSDKVSLTATPRGGYLGFAESAWCGLFRITIEDERGIEAQLQIWIDRRQATALRDALNKELTQD